MKKIILLSSAITLFFGALSVLAPLKVSAADLSRFNPENIINDLVFTNNSTMSATQIQDFLNQKNSVCLKNLSVPGLIDDNGDGVVQDTTTEQYGPETMSAAQVIKAAADIYRINPQVILATLQKEQGLITGADCSNIDTALGYGCPDTADCSDSAKGFTRQIDYGAYHLRGYFDDTLNSVPYGVGQHMVYYNPGPWDHANDRWYGRFGDRRDIEYCGGSVLNIQNRATASLYSYTPYQPNAASLAAGYGSAEPCGAYGNRNFFHFFTDWFGSTYSEGGYAIITKYEKLGGVNSWLGRSISDVRSIGSNGAYQIYEGGKIYWNKNLGAYAIRNGDINSYYGSTGYQNGYLGFPTSDEITIAGKGAYQRFQYGQLYWTSSTKAWAIKYGAMFNRFAQLGYQNSYLGFPTSGEQSTGQGVYQSFQGGRLYWRSDSRATAMDMTNEISTAYETAGGSKAYLGMPNRSTICGLKDGGCWMNFDGGKIYWSEGTGAFEIRYGAVNNEYSKYKYENGALGYPISREIPTGEQCNGALNKKQEFQNGVINWSRCATPSTHTTFNP